MRRDEGKAAPKGAVILLRCMAAEARLSPTFRGRSEIKLVGNALERSDCNDTVGSETIPGTVKTVPYVKVIS